MIPNSGWEYANPVRIVFGTGRLGELPELVEGRALVVTSPGATGRGLTGRIVRMLDRPLVHDKVSPNPTLASVTGAIGEWRAAPVNAIVAVGGGSAIDVGKVLSLALAVPDVTLDGLLEADHPWKANEPLPMVAIPTTAGTGSEVTPFATLWDNRKHRKLSVTTPKLHPAVALIDPGLAVSLPWVVTLGTGLDAYSQCFEAICNRNAMPVTTAFAERGLELVPNALRVLREDPSSSDARSDMAAAALFSGLAISHTRTGLAHSISYPITAHLGLSHGLACALALPGVLAFNAETDDGRLAKVAAQIGLRSPTDLARWLLELYGEFEVADVIREHVPDVDVLRSLASEMLTPGRADNNIRPADEHAVMAILASTERWLSAEPTAP